MIMDVGTRHTLVLLFDHWSVLVGKSNSAQPGFSHQASVCMILYDYDYVRGSNKIPHRKMEKHIVDSLTLQMQKSDQVSLKAQCWYIPEMCNSRIPEMRNSRCTRIIEMYNSGIPAMCNSCIAGQTIGAILIIP